MLMARVTRKAKDKRILKLIRLYLQSGVMIKGVKIQTKEGTPQLRGWIQYFSLSDTPYILQR